MLETFKQTAAVRQKINERFGKNLNDNSPEIKHQEKVIEITDKPLLKLCKALQKEIKDETDQIGQAFSDFQTIIKENIPDWTEVSMWLYQTVDFHNQLTQLRKELHNNIKQNVQDALQTIANKSRTSKESKNKFNKVRLEHDSTLASLNAMKRQRFVVQSQLNKASSDLERLVEQLREKEQETLKLMSDVTHQSEYEIILALSNYFEAQLKFFEKGAALVSQTLPHLKAAVEKEKKTYDDYQEREKAGKKVFGVRLEELLSREKSSVPLFIMNALSYLKKYELREGIFRLNGSTTEMKILKKDIDSGKPIDFTKVQDPNVVSGLLKLYLRELPEPLCTFALFDEFIQAAEEAEKIQGQYTEEYFKKLSQLIQKLPAPNFRLFQLLFRFLNSISTKSNVNKMNAINLAVVIGPNVLKPQGELDSYNSVNKIVEILIEHYSKIFQEEGIEDIVENYFRTVPPEDQSTVPVLIFSESEGSIDVGNPDKIISRHPSFILSKRKQEELRSMELDRIKEETSRMDAIKKRKSVEYVQPILDDPSSTNSSNSSPLTKVRDRSVSEVDTTKIPAQLSDQSDSSSSENSPINPNPLRPQRPVMGEKEKKRKERARWQSFLTNRRTKGKSGQYEISGPMDVKKVDLIQNTKAQIHTEDEDPNEVEIESLEQQQAQLEQVSSQPPNKPPPQTPSNPSSETSTPTKPSTPVRSTQVSSQPPNKPPPQTPSNQSSEMSTPINQPVEQTQSRSNSNSPLPQELENNPPSDLQSVTKTSSSEMVQSVSNTGSSEMVQSVTKTSSSEMVQSVSNTGSSEMVQSVTKTSSSEMVQSVSNITSSEMVSSIQTVSKTNSLVLNEQNSNSSQPEPEVSTRPRSNSKGNRRGNSPSKNQNNNNSSSVNPPPHPKRKGSPKPPPNFKPPPPKEKRPDHLDKPVERKPITPPPGVKEILDRKKQERNVIEPVTGVVHVPVRPPSEPQFQVPPVQYKSPSTDSLLESPKNQTPEKPPLPSSTAPKDKISKTLPHIKGSSPVSEASEPIPENRRKSIFRGNLPFQMDGTSDAQSPPPQSKASFYPSSPTEWRQSVTKSYEDLKARRGLKGLDVSKLETYLSDEEFNTVFQMSREDFYKLPFWTRNRKKIDVELF